MLNEADAAQVRAAAEAYRATLLRAGNLKRLSRAQREALQEAHSIFFQLVQQLTGPHRLHEGKLDDWALLSSVLAKHDPTWHTRGQTGVAAAIASITHLVGAK